LNLDYVVIIKQEIEKLLTICFNKSIEETTWLFPILVVPKKNKKLKTCVDFRKFNVATKKYPYLLPFMDEVITIIVGHKVYTFLDRFVVMHP